MSPDDAALAIALVHPMVSERSGRTGRQAEGPSMHERSQAPVQPDNALPVWRKAVSIGFGGPPGLLIGIVASVGKGNPGPGAVIGLALAADCPIAVRIGGAVPPVPKPFGQDTAAGGPLPTTIARSAGVIPVLRLANPMLPLPVRPGRRV